MLPPLQIPERSPDFGYQWFFHAEPNSLFILQNGSGPVLKEQVQTGLNHSVVTAEKIVPPKFLL